MTALPEKRHAGATDYFEPVASTATERRPAALTGGGLLVLLRAISGVIWLAAFAAAWPSMVGELDLAADERPIALGLIIGVSAGWAALLFLLSWFVLRGNNFVRLIVMAGSSISISSAAIGYFSAGQEITLRTTLVTLTLDILILLALSSRAARAWSRPVKGETTVSGKATAG